jgi:hypothetical protein
MGLLGHLVCTTPDAVLPDVSEFLGQAWFVPVRLEIVQINKRNSLALK